MITTNQHTKSKRTKLSNNIDKTSNNKTQTARFLEMHINYDVRAEKNIQITLSDSRVLQ